MPTLFRTRCAAGLLALCLLCIPGSTATGQQQFVCPLGMYVMTVPPGWVYQVSESSERLVVFYGAGETIFYVEHTGAVRDDDPKAWAQRTMDAYQSVHGPKDFQMIDPPSWTVLDGVDVAQLKYSFRGHRGELVEQRLLAIIDGLGVAITYGDRLDSFDQSTEPWIQAQESWRWTYAKDDIQDP